MTTHCFNSNRKRFRKLRDGVYLDLHSGLLLNGKLLFTGYTVVEQPDFKSQTVVLIVKHTRLYQPTVRGNFKLAQHNHTAANRKIAA